ncbi:MAG: ECF-type sigma factor [Planctomycetota bacterium]
MSVSSKDSPGGNEPTILLGRIARGDEDAIRQLFPIVYEELRARAGAYFRTQPTDMTIQPTALVHEAYAKLIRSSSSADWTDRAHFLAVASKAMRQILIDHARRRDKEKRAVEGYRAQPTLLGGSDGNPEADLLALEEVLSRLEGLDAQRARIVELRFFGGLGNQQVGEVLGISESTVARQWRLTKAWLSKALADHSAE